MVSSLSVSSRPVCRLHFWGSSGDQCISPLQPEFHTPLQNSSCTVSVHRLPYRYFTPIHYIKNSQFGFNRVCWHPYCTLLFAQIPSSFSLSLGLYDLWPSSSKLKTPSSVCSLRNVIYCCQRHVVWTVSQFQCCLQSFDMAIHHCLGEPLPHQLTNRKQSHSRAARKPFDIEDLSRLKSS